MTARRTTAPTLALVLLPLAAIGCSGMGRFDLDVALDHQGFQTERSTIPSVEVNFIGVNANEFPVWNQYSVNKYWMPEDPQRVTAVRQGQSQVITFGEQPPFRQIVSRTNPVWDKWKSKGATYLIALCNFPRVSQDQAGNADVRRVVLPLEKRLWSGYFWGRRRLSFEVSPRGIVCRTAPKTGQMP